MKSVVPELGLHLVEAHGQAIQHCELLCCQPAAQCGVVGPLRSVNPQQEPQADRWV